MMVKRDKGGGMEAERLYSPAVTRCEPRDSQQSWAFMAGLDREGPVHRQGETCRRSVLT